MNQKEQEQSEVGKPPWTDEELKQVRKLLAMGVMAFDINRPGAGTKDEEERRNG